MHHIQAFLVITMMERAAYFVSIQIHVTHMYVPKTNELNSISVNGNDGVLFSGKMTHLGHLDILCSHSIGYLATNQLK